MPRFTKENAREIGKKGGIKSGASRRKKRAMKDAVKLLLDLGVTSPKMMAQMEALGITEKDMTNQMAMLLTILNSAMKGDIKAAEFIRDTAGESETKVTADTKLKIEVDYGDSDE